MVHGKCDDGAYVHISGVEFNTMGQGKMRNHYAINFLNTGSCQGSFIANSAMHDNYARMFAAT